MIRNLALETVISLIALTVGILLILFRRHKGIGYASTITYGICLVVSAICWIIIIRISNVFVTSVLKIIINFIIAYLPAFVFTYILEYTTQHQRLSYRIPLILAVVPVFFLAILAVQSVSGIIFLGLESESTSIISAIDVWGWLILIYSIGILTASIIATIYTSINNLKPLTIAPLLVINGAVLVSILLGGISFTKLMPVITKYDLLLTSFTLIGGAILYANFKLRPLDLSLISRGEIINGFDDSLIVVNGNDQIIDMNLAAEQLVGVTIHQAYGTSIEKILSNWRSVNKLNDTKDSEFKGSINLNQQWRYLSVRVTTIKENRGKVIVLRDMTERKGTLEARQRTREQMFILLQSFSKAASSSQTSHDFLREVLFQISYTFRVENGAICLFEAIPDSSSIKNVVMAKQGPLIIDDGTVARIYETLNASVWLQENKSALIIPAAGQNPHLLDLSSQKDPASIAILPLLYNDNILGSLMLVQPQVKGFRSDEIVRLNIVADELASFIFFDHKKKSDIAMAERQRLVLDLHNSITQKLCGLVTLTEAIQVGIEAGAKLDENDAIARIGESARQALREMRLFLYELEPADIKKEGLIAILYQRLASVEGRSDIQARLITDGELTFKSEQEVEIYYFVQEALNNILKHAGAKSVLISFKQRKSSMRLEIVDNGCGFDPDTVKPGCKGLKNMQERAKRVKGKLKIVSSPGSGTKITLIIPQ